MGTKAIDIIRPALRRIRAIGATEQPSARQIATAMDVLNGLIDTWSVLPQTAPHSIETVVTLPANTSYLTIGAGQQINVARPSCIESAYARYQGLDEPIDVASKQRYDSVDQKALGSTWPELLWFDQGLPTGRVYFWPVSDSGIEVHITTRASLVAFPTAESEQDLPGGYLRGLRLATAVEAAPEFGLPVDAALAMEKANSFDALVSQNFVVPDLELEGSPAISTRRGQFISGGMR